MPLDTTQTTEPYTFDQIEELLSPENNVVPTLYLVTKHQHTTKLKNAKFTEKHKFKLLKVNLDENLKKQFTGIIQTNLQKTRAKLEKSHEFKEFNIIDDDDQELCTYALNNSKVLNGVIQNYFRDSPQAPETLKNLKDIANQIFAVLLKCDLPLGDDESTVQAFLFRKLTPRKVTTEKSKGIIQALVSTSAELVELNQEVITFDEHLDCICIEEQVFILNKKRFEHLALLNEEYEKAAKEALEAKAFKAEIKGFETLETIVMNDNSLKKRLTSIKKKGVFNVFNKKLIKRMAEVLKNHEGKELKLDKKGQILIEDKEDVKTLINLLNDYYKRGESTRKMYKTNAGQVIGA